MISSLALGDAFRHVGCENAPNSDPIRVLCMPLINHVNRFASKGSGSARK